MKVALVYDRVNKWGGAERLLLALHKLFPSAPLYTSIYNRKTAPWAKDFTIIPSFLQKLPWVSSSHELLAPLMPIAFESFSFDEYDLVISVTSEAAKGIRTKSTTKHICYCLTPTRYLWSGYEEYFKNGVFRFFSKPIVSYLQKWDVAAAQRPDAYIAISQEVQKRIKKYYNRDSAVVYPPVELDGRRWKVEDSTLKIENRSLINPQSSTIKKLPSTFYPLSSRNKYFLVVSRLVPYKRIDIAIEACNKLKVPLKIIGTGSSEHYLKSIAGSTIEFLGNLTDSELVGYYKNCQALLFPGKEDFGLTVLEAQSFGKPVIAFKGGGVLETIDKKTGIFFSQQNKDALIKALEQFNLLVFNKNDCIQQAEKFSIEKFDREFLKTIEKTI